MKKMVLFLLAATALSTSFAQPLSPAWAHSGPKAKKHAAFVQSLLRHQGERSVVEKPTEIKQRVIAQSFRFDTDLDSTTFRYSGNRGSAYDFNNIDVNYRDYFNDFYDPGDLLYSSTPSSMLADSIGSYQEGELYDLSYAHYRNDNQIDSLYENYYSAGSLGGSSFYLKAYNAAGSVTDIYEFDLTLVGFDSVAKQKLYYNNDFTQVLADTMWNYDMGLFVPQSARQYYYGSSGMLDSFKSYYSLGGPLQPSERVTITYYPDDKVETITTFDVSTTPQGALNYRDSFGYEPGIGYYTYWLEESWYMGGYEGGNIYRQYPNAAGVPDSITVSTRQIATDPWEDLATLAYQYNSYNNPVSEHITYMDNSPAGDAAFYYEEYDDADSTESIRPITANNDFKVYPNPFSNRISINYSGKSLTGPLQLSLTNVLGQIILEQTIQLRQGNNTISLPEMSPGNYYLLLKTADGQCWSKQLLKR